MNEFTTVAVHRATLERLRKFQEYRRESYDDTLNKLMSLIDMKSHDSDGKLNAKTRHEIEEARAEVRTGQTYSTKEAMKRLGLE